ncbi:aspartic peptidase domain-containing protein [Lasiosphaeris hirsuta]|uniref:Aspartic peptidase domain-containing protein n=1 Tax=Lasiosphaeris hirsuta TaxID=260670 RepID=A0AA39ZWR7_9PEZI|nr:aspartic peptidase domain-containing protein [Lasiosphaeris hirsuta]
MLGVALLLQLTLWVATIQAFYIWYPPGGDSGSHSRRDVDGPYRSAERDARPAGAVTYDLFQRAPSPDENAASRTARAHRVAGRLAHKYAPLEVLRAGRHPQLIGRTNRYSIVTPAPPTADNSAGIFQDGSDFSYFIEAKFGSSKKSMYMLLDSGAASTWVMGSTCRSTACEQHTTFGPDDSETYEANNKNFSIAYGLGKVSGEIVRDSITVAGTTLAMTFGAANETSDDFTHFPFDGILGLSMGKGATDNFMGLMMENKVLDARIVSVTLGRFSDGTNGGQVTFGGVDKSKFTGDITYTTVSGKGGGDWTIPMDNVGYNGKKSAVTGKLAYIDTGTSYVFGPEEDVAALHKVIPGATSSDGVTYTVPCSSNEPLTVTFSGVTYDISPKDWMSKHNGNCVSNIYGHAVVNDSWLLGDLFLKNVYSVFDADQTRIGFAKKPPIPKDAPTATLIGGPVSSTVEAGATTPSTSPITPGQGDADSTASAAGLTGGEPGATGTAGTAKPRPTGTQVSPGDQLESSVFVTSLCIVAVLALVA